MPLATDGDGGHAGDPPERANGADDYLSQAAGGGAPEIPPASSGEKCETAKADKSDSHGEGGGQGWGWSWVWGVGGARVEGGDGGVVVFCVWDGGQDKGAASVI